VLTTGYSYSAAGTYRKDLLAVSVLYQQPMQCTHSEAKPFSSIKKAKVSVDIGNIHSETSIKTFKLIQTKLVLPFGSAQS
jgi:type IV secretory pathway TrbF-like protein